MNLVSLTKWGLKSVGGLALNVVLLTVWVEYGGLSPAIAIVPNFLIISALGYTVTNKWIWPSGVTPSGLRAHARQYLGMQAANGAGKAANYAIYLALIPHAQYQLAWVTGAILTFLVTFGLNQWWWTTRQSARSVP